MMKMANPPNILLITSDQQHFSTLGIANPRIQTPALDRLCREGTRFTRAYCPNPTCTPTRASIITGLYPSEHGAWTLGTKLPESVPTVGDALRLRGYRTALVGKAHFQQLDDHPDQRSIESYPTLRDLDFWRGFRGPWYGFEHVETTRPHADESHVGGHYAIWMEEKGFTGWRDYFASYPGTYDEWMEKRKTYTRPGRPGSWTLPEEFHYTTWTGERTIAQIEAASRDGKPFFLWSSYHDPHPPYLVPEPWASMYDPADMEPGTLEPGEFDRMPPHFRLTQQRGSDWSGYRESGFANHGFSSHLHDRDKLKREMAIYYGMISFMDRWIGRTLDRLDELGLAENTIVVFSTDHGHFLGQHGLIAKGAFHYEDLIRVPFVVRWPDRVPAGAVSEALQNLVDLPGTFLDAAGGSDDKARLAMGQSVGQLGVWRGEQAAARASTVVEFRHQPTKVHLRTYVTTSHKITIYRDHEYGELFDLQNDPNERNNLWDSPEHAGLKAQMLHTALSAELRREPLRQPRVAHA